MNPSVQEFKEARDKLGDNDLNAKWEDVFSHIDLDGDGRVDFHEFYAAGLDHKKLLTE